MSRFLDLAVVPTYQGSFNLQLTELCTTVCYITKQYSEGMSVRECPLTFAPHCRFCFVLNRTRQGFVWFCLCVYLLHLHERTTRTRYLNLFPSIHTTVTFLVLTSSATQRHSLLRRLMILEYSGNQGSSSIGKHCPSQIKSRIGLLLVQRPFDTYLRIRIPWHPRLRIPDVWCGFSNSKPVSSGEVWAAFVSFVAATRGIDSADGSFCPCSRAFWRAITPSQHLQTTTTSSMKFHPQNLLNRIIMRRKFFPLLRKTLQGSLRFRNKTFRVRWLAVQQLGGECQ